MFKENYLTEIPDDILEIIDMYWRQDDYNIHIKTERDNFSWRYNSFIDDRMHKSICRLNYVYKAGVDTRAFTNRAKIAGEKLKNHIDDIIKYMKMPKVKRILRNNRIYNAKKVYERNNPGNNSLVSNYEKALLSQYIF
jgi:hypothetical protein